MGFGAWIRGEYREGARERADLARAKLALRHSEIPIEIHGDDCLLFGGVHHTYGILGADIVRASVSMLERQKVKAGRVIGGAVLAGPAGAIVGGMAKKSELEILLDLNLSNGTRVGLPVPFSREVSRWIQRLVQRINSPIDAPIG